MAFTEDQVNRGPDGKFRTKNQGRSSGVELDLTDPEDLQEALQVIHINALARMRSNALDGYARREDFLENLKAESAEKVFKQAKKNNPRRPSISPEIIGGLVSHIYARLVDNAYSFGSHNIVSDRASSNTMKAKKLFYDQREALERRLGRALSDREEDELAAKVRLSFTSSKHRPPRGFHRRVISVEYLPDSDYRQGELIEDVLDRRQGHNPRYEAALAAIEGAPVMKKSAMVWELYVPGAVAADTVTRREAMEARKVLDSYPDGVLGMIAEWDAGEDSKGTRALLLPFGDIGDDYRAVERITSFLSSKPALADSLYRAALMVATVR